MDFLLSLSGCLHWGNFKRSGEQEAGAAWNPPEVFPGLDLRRVKHSSCPKNPGVINLSFSEQEWPERALHRSLLG